MFYLTTAVGYIQQLAILLQMEVKIITKKEKGFDHSCSAC